MLFLCEGSFTSCSQSFNHSYGRRQRMELLIPVSGLIYSTLGGGCFGAALIFPGIASLKCTVKDLTRPYLTEPTASMFLTSLPIVLLGLRFDVFSPRVLSTDRALCILFPLACSQCFALVWIPRSLLDGMEFKPCRA